MKEITWQTHVELAAHHLALNEREIHIYANQADIDYYPWEFVSKLETGGAYRYGVNVSRYFKGEHPCGITFSWSIDVEERDSNGAGKLRPNVPYLRAVRARLKGKLLSQWDASFAEMVAKMSEQASEYEAEAAKLRTNAALLNQAIAEKP